MTPNIAIRLGAVAAVLALGTVPAGAQSVSVTIDGRPASLDPSPLERTGRVFVPLRGVFEKLGAGVVYENGAINATGNGRTVSLHIGSTQASVNGQPQTLDVAPFIVGASTYVPLRFVAQALGASVNWDNSNRIVALGTNNAVAANPPAPQQRPPAPEAPPRSTLRLGNPEPSLDASVQSNRPAIGATFTDGQANPNTVRVRLDQLDVTNNTSRSPSGVMYSPPSDLQPMRHNVQVTGNDERGLPFDLRWTFVSGTQAQINTISDLSPANGAAVKSSFTVRGRTMPGSRVTIEAGAGADVGGMLAFGTGSYRGDTVADASGNFAQDVSLNAVRGGYINLIVSSTAPGTKAAAPQIRRRLAVHD